MLAGYFYFILGLLCPAAFAGEGNLILPAAGNSNVEFVLERKPSGVDSSEILQVYVGGKDVCCSDKSPIAGRYHFNDRIIRFEPAFDFVAGQIYTVMIDENYAANGGEHRLTEFTVNSAKQVVSPEVVAIYPSGSAIPENTLRFYIHFSTPMMPHVSTDYIKLIDATGTPDTAAFMKFKQELWSEDRKRLTLLMDPGRIKRGVAQNLTLGPALLEGNKYSLVVEKGWPSANGEEELPRFESAFFVSHALRIKPDVNLWSMKLPRSSTSDQLVIEFDRSFDYELLQSGIVVLDEDGQIIPGTVTIEQGESNWRFTPNELWKSKQVQIVIDSRLEDVAGNNFRELLDHSANTEMQNTHQQIVTLNLKPPPM